MEFTAGGKLTNGAYIGGGAGGVATSYFVGGAGGTAVAMVNGGTVVNSAAGTIVGGAGGAGAGANATNGDGVSLGAGGLVQNSGLIEGYIGVSGGTAAAASVQNYATVTATGYGVTLGYAGSSLYNGPSGTIYGARGGVSLSATGTVTNKGTIKAGSNYDGLTADASSTGAVINNSGYIYGWFGVKANAYVSITNSGTIEGHRDGIYLQTGMLTNTGSIGSAFFAVDARGAATIVNQAGAVISGGNYSVYLGGAGGVAKNYGTLNGTANLYAAGCALTNGSASDTTALIQNGFYGVYERGAGSITNFGTIKAQSSGKGVKLNGGTLLNEASGTITGGYQGVSAAGAATVINYGFVQGSGRNSFNSSSGRMVVGAGSTEVGVIDGDYLATLEIGGGTAGSAGTITGLGYLPASLSGGASASFRNFNTYVIDAGASWTIASGILASGKTLTDNGTVTLGGAFENDGQILGGAGANGTYGYAGTIGGDALHGGVLAEFTNTGTVTGGGGGAGGGFGPGRSSIDGAAGGAGVSLASGGTITNSGHIYGGAGAAGLSGGGAGGSGGGGGTALVASNGANSGLIEGGAGGAAGSGGVSGHGGNGGAGVNLAAGASFSNTGTILGGAGGAAGVGPIHTFPGGQQGAGVYLTSGLLTNGYAGESVSPLIEGGDGVYAQTGATVDNFGTIDGTYQFSVRFQSASDRLIAENGSKFMGAMSGGNGTLELAGGTGTISGLGGSYGTISGGVSGIFTSFHAYQLDAGGSWTLTGASVIGSAQELSNAGTLIIGPGASLTDGGELNYSGVIDIGGAPGKAYAGLDFSGAHQLAGGGTISLNATGYISGVTLGDSLTNIDNTIEGGGFIRGPLTLTNDGTIDNNVGRMLINTNNEVVNDGLMESTGTGTLLIRDTVILSSGGGRVIDAKRMQLDGSTLFGGALTIAAGGLLVSVFQGGTVALAGGTVVNDGVIDGESGGLNIGGDVANNGIMQGYNGTLTVTGAVSGTGKVRVFGAGVLEVDGALGQNAFFAAGSTGTLILGDVTTSFDGFTGRVYGLSTTGKNSIDLKNLAYDATDTVSFSGSTVGGTLTIANGATVLATIKLSGNYKGHTFNLSGDTGGGTSGGTVIKDPPTAVTLASAIAGFGADGAGSASTAAHASPTPPALSLPH